MSILLLLLIAPPCVVPCLVSPNPATPHRTTFIYRSVIHIQTDCGRPSAGQGTGRDRRERRLGFYGTSTFLVGYADSKTVNRTGHHGDNLAGEGCSKSLSNPTLLTAKKNTISNQRKKKIGFRLYALMRWVRSNNIPQCCPAPWTISPPIANCSLPLNFAYSVSSPRFPLQQNQVIMRTFLEDDATS